MISVSTGVLAQLIGSLVQGTDNIIEKSILGKIEDLGRDTIADLIRATPLGAGLSAVQRYKNFTGMNSREFQQARDEWLNTLTEQPTETKTKRQGGVGSRLLDKIQEAFQAEATKQTKEERPEGGGWKWSKSRQEWLREDWRHDWRSQPRDADGRWIEGRLNYVYMARGRASKKVRSARRRAARKRVKWNAKTSMYE